MITLRTPEDALALIPHLLGYVPDRKIIFISLDSQGSDATGEPACIGPVLVLDPKEQEPGYEQGQVLAQLVEDYGVTCALIVYFCDDVSDSAERDLRQRIKILQAMALQAQVQTQGGGMVFAYALDDEFYLRLDRPSLPHPVSELQASEAAAAMVFEGSAPQKRDPYKIVEVTGERLDGARDAAALCSGGTKEASELGLSVLSYLMELGEKAEETLGSNEEPRPGPLAFGLDYDQLMGCASAALANVLRRDTVLIWGLGHRKELDWASMDQDKVGEYLAEAMLMPPNLACLRATVRMLDRIAGYELPGKDQALASAAYLYWWACHNSTAALRANEARKLCEKNSLSNLILDTLSAGVMAPWFGQNGRAVDECV